MKNPIIGRGWSFPPKINQQGGIMLTDEETDIQQAIRIILSTAPGERVMRPTFGSRLHELVFASINQETLLLAQRYVEQALKMWEPRIELTTVDVSWNRQENDGLLLITLDYLIKTTHDRRTLVYPFYLIPAE
jgi:phage baseplate assembly protein W